ncbi:DMT family transporter [Vibrio algarum]|uniref:DMT family transporter n=1 Tax=Vibrio algarum TaxID=3020714 RepID=A0ABT4YQ35_9VIBR|nr:DMT family transporter [Vibrio sp. KJ40-1]MDB1123512.1 DMT family transporter [Vibrio sp. KJ40-1]
MKTFLLTFIAMLAFAANSILCRVALLEGYIDAGSFTLIRILSGATTLLIITIIYNRSNLVTASFNRKSVLVLSISLLFYALFFSLAYIELGTGTGALILFGVVQLSMLATYAYKGNRIIGFEWLGIGVAVSGFLILLLPSATRPDPLSALLMALSGVCWAIFTLQGKVSGKPLQSTTQGFVGSALLALLMLPWLLSIETISRTGLMLAVCSGIFTSALGYVIWYMALRQLTVLTASIVQLSVPGIALLGGVILVGEPLSFNIALSTMCILGGIALVFIAQQKKRMLN